MFVAMKSSELQKFFYESKKKRRFWSTHSLGTNLFYSRFMNKTLGVYNHLRDNKAWPFEIPDVSMLTEPGQSYPFIQG